MYYSKDFKHLGKPKGALSTFLIWKNALCWKKRRFAINHRAPFHTRRRWKPEMPEVSQQGFHHFWVVLAFSFISCVCLLLILYLLVCLVHSSPQTLMGGSNPMLSCSPGINLSGILPPGGLMSGTLPTMQSTAQAGTTSPRLHSLNVITKWRHVCTSAAGSDAMALVLTLRCCYCVLVLSDVFVSRREPIQPE